MRELEINGETLNLNIAKQLTLPFLYDKPATFRAKLFNMLTGNDLVDKVVQNINKELLSISRDLKVEGEFVQNNEPQLNILQEQINNKKNIYNILKEKLEQIKDNYNKLNKLQEKSLRLTTIQEGVDKCKEDLKKYSKSIDSNKLEEIKKNNERLSTLKNLAEMARINTIAINAVNGSLKEIRAISPEKVAQAKAILDRLAKLKPCFEHLRDNWQTLEATREESINLEQKVLTTIEKYRELRKQAPLCEKCGQIIKPECIVKEI